VRGAGGAFGFHIDSPGSCKPENPPTCPETPAPFHAITTSTNLCDLLVGRRDASTGSEIVSCYYDQEMCAWVDSSTGCNYDCVAYSSFSLGPSPCPWPRPRAGDACGPSARECVYHDLPCSTASAGPPLVCENGYWERDTRPMCIP